MKGYFRLKERRLRLQNTLSLYKYHQSYESKKMCVCIKGHRITD